MVADLYFVLHFDTNLQLDVKKLGIFCTYKLQLGTHSDNTMPQLTCSLQEAMTCRQRLKVNGPGLS